MAKVSRGDSVRELSSRGVKLPRGTIVETETGRRIVVDRHNGYVVSGVRSRGVDTRQEDATVVGFDQAYAYQPELPRRTWLFGANRRTRMRPRRRGRLRSRRATRAAEVRPEIEIHNIVRAAISRITRSPTAIKIRPRGGSFYVWAKVPADRSSARMMQRRAADGLKEAGYQVSVSSVYWADRSEELRGIFTIPWIVTRE